MKPTKKVYTVWQPMTTQQCLGLFSAAESYNIVSDNWVTKSRINLDFLDFWRGNFTQGENVWKGFINIESSEDKFNLRMYTG